MTVISEIQNLQHKYDKVIAKIIQGDEQRSTHQDQELLNEVKTLFLSLQRMEKLRDDLLERNTKSILKSKEKFDESSSKLQICQERIAKEEKDQKDRLRLIQQMEQENVSSQETVENIKQKIDSTNRRKEKADIHCSDLLTEMVLLREELAEQQEKLSNQQEELARIYERQDALADGQLELSIQSAKRSNMSQLEKKRISLQKEYDNLTKELSSIEFELSRSKKELSHLVDQQQSRLAYYPV